MVASYLFSWLAALSLLYLSSIGPSPADMNALERRSAACESPEEEMMAAFLYCSA